MPDALIPVGVVGRPHGVRGLVHVHAWTEDPQALEAYAPLLDGQGRAWTLRWRGEGVAELRDADGRAVPDRDAAARLTNLRLHVPRERLPETDEEEFYLADLVGLRAWDAAGAALGTVLAVHDHGAGAFLEVSRPEGQPLLVPFTRAAVPVVDVSGGRVVLDPPAELEVPPDAAEPRAGGSRAGESVRDAAARGEAGAADGEGRPSAGASAGAAS